MESTQQAETVLEAFWAFAHKACRKIARSRPDLVMVLYHSGQAVLRATQAAWEATRGTPSGKR